jgi:predicted TIM-barrel fold metal-dependent hydrolase
MKNGFKIVDSDLHVIEPPTMYKDYMDPKFREKAPKWTGHLEHSAGGWALEDMEHGGPEWVDKDTVSRGFLIKRKEQYYVEEKEQGYTPQLALKAMDLEGIDVAIMFRSTVQMSMHIEGQDPEYTMSLCRAFNDWLADFIKTDPRRLLGAAMIPLNDIPAAAKEAERAVKDLDMVAVTLLSTPLNERMPHDPECDLLWETLQDLNVPATFHDTSGGYSKMNPGYWFREHPNNLVLTHAFSFPLTLMMTIGCMTVGGVLQRFPRLKAAFLEGNCSWLPWLLYRLDEQWEIFGEGQHIQLEQLPSEYFKERCFVSVESDGELLQQVVETVGDDNIVLSTDYPHEDSNYPFAIETFLSYDGVSDETKKKILWDNCARLYSLNGY